MHDKKYYEWKWGNKPKIAKATQAWTNIREGPRVQAQGIKCRHFGADLKEARSMLKNKEGIGNKINNILARWTHKSAEPMGFDENCNEWKLIHKALVQCKCEGTKPRHAQGDVTQTIDAMIVTIANRTQQHENEAKQKQERMLL